VALSLSTGSGRPRGRSRCASSSTRGGAGRRPCGAPRLHHHEPAVDGEDVTRDVRGLVGGEERDGVGDLLGRPEAAEGVALRIASWIVSGRPAVSSVSTKPGATALHVMPRLATSRATAFVRPMSPAFAAE